jgi:hypothetical protein
VRETHHQQLNKLLRLGLVSFVTFQLGGCAISPIHCTLEPPTQPQHTLRLKSHLRELLQIEDPPATAEPKQSLPAESQNLS